MTRQHPIQYELVTSLAGNNNALAHSHGYNKISHALSMHYPIFMACTDAAVISLTSHLYTV